MRRSFSFAALILLAACAKGVVGPVPHQIHIVGSSTAFPFSTAVAERFMRAQADAIAPLVQAGGEADGFSRFCAGLGALHPDVVGATRPMTLEERGSCRRNGVRAITPIPIGHSAIVLVARRQDAAPSITRAELERALTTPVTYWSEINPRLSRTPILIHGPSFAAADSLVPRSGLRGDGAYRSHGADPDIVAEAVAKQRGAIGIMPWPQALAHADTLRILPLDHVAPTPATIASHRYPASLPVLLFVKTDEAGVVPGLPALLALYAEAWGPKGDFAAHGLVPLPEAERRSSAAAIAALPRP